MRLILSRKGFDSSYGGVASPILPDGRLCSLPIPVPYDDGATFEHVMFEGSDIGGMVESLTNGAVKRSANAHLDPDLRRDARPRELGWLPAFGQSDSAARHLARQEVTVGDLFLFFGWFRQTTYAPSGLRFDRSAPDLHVIYGWLQVGAILKPGENDCPSPSWLRAHPHVSGHSAKARSNVIYIANPTIQLDGLDSWPGGGVFEHYSSALSLTAPNSRLRSQWLLPRWFCREPRLTYHSNPERWSVRQTDVLLKSTGRGQEFVINCGRSQEPVQWVRGMFQASPPNPALKRSCAARLALR